MCRLCWGLINRLIFFLNRHIKKQMESTDIINFKIIVVGHQGSTPHIDRSREIFIGGSIYQGGVFGELQCHSWSWIRHQNSPARTRQADSPSDMGYCKNHTTKAGQELFRSLVKSFYKGISAVFFVYSVDSLESFDDLRSWSAEVKEYAHEEVVIFLIATKGDI